MKRTFGGHYWIAAVGIGCALTAIPKVAQAAAEPLAAKAASPVDQELRLETIGYRLRQSNAGQCQTPEILTGMILHDIGSYSAKARATLADQLGLTYGFGVQKFVPDSAADRAGLIPRDEIVAVNGQDLRSFATDAIGRKATYDRTGRFVELLSAALRQGPATLRVRRNGSELEIVLTGEQGCGGGMVLVESSQLNAWSDGKNTAVTTRMMQLAGSDDELAFVVSHEMAHNILKHAQKLERRSSLLAEFGIGSRKVKRAEVEADTLAMNLLANAAYDLDAPERFLRRAAPLQVLDLAISHPGISTRIEMARNERDRIRSAAIAQHELATPALARRDARHIPFLNDFARMSFASVRSAGSSAYTFEAAASEDLNNLALATRIASPTAILPSDALALWTGVAPKSYRTTRQRLSMVWIERELAQLAQHI